MSKCSYKKYEPEEFKSINEGTVVKYFEKKTHTFQEGRVSGYVYKDDNIFLKVNCAGATISVSTPVWVKKNNTKESTEMEMEVYQLKKIVFSQSKEINELKKKLLKVTEIIKKNH